MKLLKCIDQHLLLCSFYGRTYKRFNFQGCQIWTLICPDYKELDCDPSVDADECRWFQCFCIFGERTQRCYSVYRSYTKLLRDIFAMHFVRPQCFSVYRKYCHCNKGGIHSELYWSPLRLGFMATVTSSTKSYAAYRYQLLGDIRLLQP